MPATRLTEHLSVSPQLQPTDLAALAAAGFRTVINNRPDGEEPGQPAAAQIAAAAADAGLACHHVPAVSGAVSDDAADAFDTVLASADVPVLAFCRSGTRSATLWALSQRGRQPVQQILQTVAAAGYDLSGIRERLQGVNADTQASSRVDAPAASVSPSVSSKDDRYDVVIVGGGAGGIATASSLLARRPQLSIAIIEPRAEHYYQPGWTMVGGGIFDAPSTRHTMQSVMPAGATWVRDSAVGFEPDNNTVRTQEGRQLRYRALVMAPGNRLAWESIPGLVETLGRNGVTSNYSYDTAPYTWELVQQLREGVALFTQPPMPIKCAGAPQKAMYLSCDAWQRRGVLDRIDVQFHNAGAVLFGVKDYVPALMEYVERYGIDLNFESTLVAVDGPARTAVFKTREGEVSKTFDMLHVTPPQKGPRCVEDSVLADAAGYVEVDKATLQHVRWPNIFGLGDGGSTPNAKTAAAARKQAPIVATNLLALLDDRPLPAHYNGYGSCPLTVENGRIVLAEFGYDGVLLPTFPTWVNDGTRPTQLAWRLKRDCLPWVYWNCMLKGREWLATPDCSGGVRSEA